MWSTAATKNILPGLPQCKERNDRHQQRPEPRPPNYRAAVAALLPDAGDAAVGTASAGVHADRGDRRMPVPVLRVSLRAEGRPDQERALTFRRVLVVAPSWVGDAVLSQPLLALMREQSPECEIDVLAPAWVAPVYRRMAEVRAVVTAPFRHGELALRTRWRLGRSLRSQSYDRAVVLPNTFKSALVP